MKYACDSTLEYLKTRKQFGVSIGTFQALQHRMVDMFISLEQARLMACLACSRADADGDARAISAAKIRIGDAARHISQESVQLHGGMGMTEELKVSHTFRRLTALAREFGDAEIVALIAPRGLVIEYSRAPEVSGPPAVRPGRKGGAAVGSLSTPTRQSVEEEFNRIATLLPAEMRRWHLIVGPEGKVYAVWPQAYGRFAMGNVADMRKLSADKYYGNIVTEVQPTTRLTARSSRETDGN